MIDVLVYLFIFASIFLISFLITSGILYGICWAFGITFTWKIAFGVWLIASVLSSTIKNK